MKDVKRDQECDGVERMKKRKKECKSEKIRSSDLVVLSGLDFKKSDQKEGISNRSDLI